MITADLTQKLLSLSVDERITLADQLYASVPPEWQESVDQAWLKEAERRAAEMDTDPSASLTAEEFYAGLDFKRSHP